MLKAESIALPALIAATSPCSTFTVLVLSQVHLEKWQDVPSPSWEGADTPSFAQHWEWLPPVSTPVWLMGHKPQALYRQQTLVGCIHFRGQATNLINQLVLPAWDRRFLGAGHSYAIPATWGGIIENLVSGMTCASFSELGEWGEAIKQAACHGCARA